MTRNTIAALVLAVTAATASLPVFAAEPSLHEVYQAADSGRLGEAQTMMQEVLRSHPNSGKAHFVEAELLAKQGQFEQAGNELALAEKLAPGLPFAKPQTVENLRSLLRAPHGRPTPTQTATPVAAPAASFPWGLLLGGLGLIAFIVWAMRLMVTRTTLAPVSVAAGGLATPYGPAGQAYGYGGPAAAAPTATPTAGSGLGSRLMGGLATGAAVGAGVVAGEALMRHFVHDDEQPSQHLAPTANDGGRDSYLNDLGGSDFGVSDSASWDDGGGSDWN